ncbi:MAG TPA: MFS transporter [Vicinamibacterales bacterium]|nr:MFS transporter [Vicinamibacterales bacterium]
MQAPYGQDPSGNPLDRYGLSRPVWLLGWVSFFTDMATEMIYPLLPLFLTRTLGGTAMSLGVIEGVAEAANSALKIFSGWLTDRSGQPKTLVLAGYGLSSAVRPLIGLVTSWPQVLALRFTDRLGKGIRSSPRDAMLARFAPPGTRGRVYGFHRAMDHAGAVAGPLIATAYLYFYPDAYRSLFAWTLVPGIVVILLILRLPAPPKTGTVTVSAEKAPPKMRDPQFSQENRSAARGKGDSPRFWRGGLPRRFYLAMAIITVFALGNASDAFILLRLTDLGIAPVWIPLLWSALHVVKMSASVIGGTLSDRFGRRALIIGGYLWYAAIYAAFAWTTSVPIVIAIFLAYGIYFGFTEGVEKAWVADMAPASARGIAFGIYNGALGAGGLAASLIFGAIWTRVSPAAAFLTGASLALAASVLLYLAFSHAQDPGHQR